MAILGTLLKKGIRLRESIEQQYSSPVDLQKEELKKLLIHARNTAFGQHYHFNDVLGGFKSHHSNLFYQNYVNNVPIHSYDKIFDRWWSLAKAGERDVCWPGKVKYFALSSGTSGAPSKYIPVTKDIFKSMKRTSIRQILSLSKYDLPDNFFTKGILMLGGSTSLQQHGNYFAGDLSGITASQIPFWFQHFYKPGKKIAKTSDWSEKLDEITLKAKGWDIGIIVGVPAWLQILLEKIVDHYQVKTIHEIWPNLQIFVHGGVSFEPYKKGFEKLLAKPLIYMETYLASEGFIAFQSIPGAKSMRLVLNNGIFYEFVPFTEENFTDDGDMVDNPKTIMIDAVEENKEYALLISTNAGAWRYMIGDTIKFTSKLDCEIVITGRTKHFLSLCGEHLSLENMNKAIELASDELNIDIREFTVIGEKHENLFAHSWYVGTDDPVDEKLLNQKIDQHLCALNDDYKTERCHALKNVFLKVLPADTFIKWMKLLGKEGGQNKFPRVLKNTRAAEWRDYLKENRLIEDKEDVEVNS